MEHINKNLAKIADAFNKLNKKTKKTIRIGFTVSLVLLAAGTLIIAANHTFLSFDNYTEFTGQSIVTSAFTVLAEIVIGSLLIDHVFKG